MLLGSTQDSLLLTLVLFIIPNTKDYRFLPIVIKSYDGVLPYLKSNVLFCFIAGARSRSPHMSMNSSQGPDTCYNWGIKASRPCLLQVLGPESLTMRHRTFWVPYLEGSSTSLHYLGGITSGHSKLGSCVDGSGVCQVTVI